MSDAHAGRGTPGRANPAEPFTLDLARGLRLCVEPRLDNISTCAFLEGEDWFEDETGFVEELARLTWPDALDVGADLGYYSLLIATASGGVSRVTAFEPNPRTAQLLRRSLQADRSGHLHVTVDERAVGERPGTAILQAGASPELDRVAPAGSPGLPVSVTSLDAATAERAREQTTGVARVAFVKLDVEGHEQQAFAGARRLIEQDDPLWMVEARDGTQLSPAAARALQP